jgi:plasmid stability protein
MGQLLVRNLDDELLRRLKAQAAAHGRSVEAEHREILRAALADPPGERNAEFKRLAALLRAETAGRPQVPSEVLQREGRDER